MSFFYLDDSKHPHEGFVLATFVALPHDPTSAIEQALREHGLTPHVDEFKSSHTMANNPHLHALRDALRELLVSAKVGVAVTSSEPRLASCSTVLLSKMLKHDGLAGEHQVYMDEGIYCRQQDRKNITEIGGAERCTFHFQEDSRHRLGIQLADIVAYTCGLMMKDPLGLLPKVIKFGENSGYDPESPMELGFFLWASLRYNFLSVGPQNID